MEAPTEYFPPDTGGLCPRLTRKPGLVTVLVAENRTLVRLGICAVLAQEKDLCVIGQASDGPQAVELAKKLHPHVVLISDTLALANRMQDTRRMLRASPASRVLILARQNGDDRYFKHAVTLGVAGYVTEQISGQMLARDVREAHRGGNVLDAGVPRHCPERPSARPADAALRESTGSLTSRQRQILQLIAEGNANKQTAADLSISVKTVEKHRHALMAKLGIYETAGLTRYAISAGIMPVAIACDSDRSPLAAPAGTPRLMNIVGNRQII